MNVVLNATNGTETLTPEEEAAGLSNALAAIIVFQAVVTIPVMSIFLWFRNKYPRVYEPRSMDEYHADVPGSQGTWAGAQEPMPKFDMKAHPMNVLAFVRAVHAIPMSTMLAKSSPDFVMFVMLMRFLFLFFCALNFLFVLPILMPVTASSPSAFGYVGIKKFTLGNINNRSSRFYVHVVGCYVFCGLLVYLLYALFETYQGVRRAVLKRHKPENYSVFVSGIPQSSSTLASSFERKSGLEVLRKMADMKDPDEAACAPKIGHGGHTTDADLQTVFETLAPDSVVSARVAVLAPALGKKRQELDRAMRKLERALHDHAENAQASKDAPMARNSQTRGPGNFFLGDKVEAVPYWTDEVKRLEAEITLMQGDPDAALEVLSPAQLARRAAAVSRAASKRAGGQVAKAKSKRKAKASGEDTDKVDELKDSEVEDALEAADEVDETMEEAKGGRHLTTVGVVTFKDIAVANRMSQMLLTDNPLLLACKPAPSPENIVWRSLNITPQQHDIRALIVVSAIALMVVQWTAILALVSQLANLTAYADNSVIGPIIRSIPPGALAAISGILPPILTSAVISLVPLIFTRLAVFSGVLTFSGVQTQVSSWYFAFLFVTVFVFQSLTSAAETLIDQFTCLVQEPFQIILVLGLKVPESAFYFVFYVIQTSLSAQALQLLGVASVAKAILFTKFFAKTDREVKEAAQPPPFKFGAELGFVLFMFVLCFTYSILSPLMAPFAVVYFGAAYIRIKYKLAYVHVPEYQAGGDFFPFAVGRVFAGLYLTQLTVMGVLLTREFPAAAIMVPLPLITYYYHRRLNQRFHKACSFLPELERAAMPPNDVGGDEFADAYMHPAYRDMSLGWDAKHERTPIAGFQALTAKRRSYVMLRNSRTTSLSGSGGETEQHSGRSTLRGKGKDASALSLRLIGRGANSARKAAVGLTRMTGTKEGDAGGSSAAAIPDVVVEEVESVSDDGGSARGSRVSQGAEAGRKKVKRRSRSVTREGRLSTTVHHHGGHAAGSASRHSRHAQPPESV
jgi:hypothetical protein